MSFVNYLSNSIILKAIPCSFEDLPSTSHKSHLEVLVFLKFMNMEYFLFSIRTDLLILMS